MYEMTNFQMKLELFKRRHINNYYPIYRCNFPINLESYILSFDCTVFHRKLALNYLYLLSFFQGKKRPFKEDSFDENLLFVVNLIKP